MMTDNVRENLKEARSSFFETALLMEVSLTKAVREVTENGKYKVRITNFAPLNDYDTFSYANDDAFITTATGKEILVGDMPLEDQIEMIQMFVFDSGLPKYEVICE